MRYHIVGTSRLHYTPPPFTKGTYRWVADPRGPKVSTTGTYSSTPSGGRCLWYDMLNSRVPTEKVDLVAQLVERRPDKAEVDCSSQSRINYAPTMSIVSKNVLTSRKLVK